MVDLFLRSPGSSECPKSRADWKPAVAASFLHPSQNSPQNATPWPLNPVRAPLLLRPWVDPVRKFTYGVLTWLAVSAAPVGEPSRAATSGGSRRLTALTERLPHPFTPRPERGPATPQPHGPGSLQAHTPLGEVKENIDLQGFWLTRRRRLGGGWQTDTFATQSSRNSPFSLGIRTLPEATTRTSVTTLLPLGPLPSSSLPSKPTAGASLTPAVCAF